MSKLSWLSSRFITILIWVVALAIRLYSATRPAQLYDMATFEAWSRSFWTYGPQAFFNSVWSDYLPLPIITFAPVSIISDFLSTPFSLIFKLIHLGIELLLISLISGISILPRALLLLSPALIGDTAFWGQVDTIPSLLALLSLTTSSPILFGLAVAYKPIMILIAPIMWITAVKMGKTWWQYPLISSFIFFLSAIPTGGQNFISHIFDRVFAQTSTYPYLTINAFNLWSLRPNLSWVSDTLSVLGIPSRSFGFVIFILLSLVILNYWRRASFSAQYAARIAATILIVFFTFTTRMHERHLLFGLPFLTFAVASQFWLIIPLLLLTFTFSLNLYGAYFWVNNTQTWPFSPSEISLISWITVLTSIGLALIWDLPSLIKKLKIVAIKNITLILILILAILLRFTNLSYPTNYIFDEVYHAFTSREYLNNHIAAWEWWTTPPDGVAYEWTHPPVAKYGMVVGMLLFGENSFGWRIGSAAFGVLSIIGLYLLVFQVTKSKQTSLLSIFLVSIEGLHIAQSRIAMNDIYMLCFFIWSLYAAIKMRWKSSAILFGLSLASKWSAVYGVLPLACIYLHENILSSQAKSRNNSTLVRMTLKHIVNINRLLAISLVVYILTFTPFILAGHTWSQWWELHRQMWYYHTHLVATHGYQSTPAQWIFGARPVWYFVNYLGDNISNIYAQSNPFILWFGLVAMTMQLAKLRSFQYSIFFVLYSIFTLPWIISPRIMFYYHYLPSSVFLCVILSSWLTTLPPKSTFYISAICFAVLLLILPMLYGLPMSHAYWDTLFAIFPSWK